MGVVYEARSAGGRLVAIKMPYRDNVDDPYFRRRMRSEALAGALVSHPAVLSIHDHAETASGIPYLVMERVAGVPLSEIRKVSVSDAIDIVQQLLGGLGALHELGIVHGDVKTENVLVERRDDRYIAKVIDLGLAQLATGLGDSADELISGTPFYMAPEVIRGEGSSASSDLYSAGVILFELVAGVLPFPGATSTEIFRRHLREVARWPEGATVPAELDSIVRQALAKAPARRFATAAGFAAALRTVPTTGQPPVWHQFGEATTLDVTHELHRVQQQTAATKRERLRAA